MLRREASMGWWEQSSNRWEVCVVAQLGGASVLGGGAFFFQFRSADLSVTPNYVAVAGGLGAGGSIGSGLSIPYRSIIRRLINPRAATDRPGVGWNALSGTFSAKNLNHSRLDIAQATASLAVVGAQLMRMRCDEWRLLGRDRRLFDSGIEWPRNLRQLTNALLDVPQVQGGFGAGAFAFRGIMQYIGH
jgi:hypothetical protein